MATVSWLESLHTVLLEEERELALLVALALEEQEALILSDAEAVTAVSTRMLSAAGRMEAIEARREAILAEAGYAGSTLTNILPVAAESGMTTLADSRDRLVSLASDLRDAQERNARLILGALRIRERWANMLASMGAPTYAASGRAAPRDGSTYLSKSA
ncbi:MAG: flagellar protein FlgN [Chloroflexi bacterium]|nr:flagellar protein FlgN [Chloroflexota bacterium]